VICLVAPSDARVRVTIDWRFVLTVLECFLPSPPLSAYVETFGFSEGDAPLHTRERCLPNGRVALVINLGHDTLRVSNAPAPDQFQSFHGGVLHGAFSQFSVIDTTTLVTTMSVCFKPGGARPFLPMPASELTNQVVDLSTLWGTAAVSLREQLQTAQTKDDMVRILERFLLARAAWEQTRHPAITFALTQFQDGRAPRSISEVTTQLGLSPKRFIHLFEEAVGLTPKVFCRLLRFQEGLQRITRRQPVRWADLALDAGYFDQAHFIHNFQAFAGLTPNAYLAQRGEHHNHVPLPD
jgi:AraC-like DNA-binding protein